VILKQLLRQMIVLAMAGVVVGSAAALALTGLIRAMLFGIGATDPATYLSVAALLGTVVLLATYFPARRAMRIDPVSVLRRD